MAQTPLAFRAAGWRRLFVGVRNGTRDPEKHAHVPVSIRLSHEYPKSF